MELLPIEMVHPIGGETTCIEVRHGDEFLIIDMGSGVRRLGYELMNRPNKIFHVLMTHTHWDHIQGWPFFVPAYIPGNTIHFHSACADLRKRFSYQQKFEFFPVPLKGMPSKKQFHLFTPGSSFQIGPFHIDTLALPHPGGCISYRISVDHQRFIFATDTEFFGKEVIEHIRTKKSYFENSDLLIIDAQYTKEEAEKKIGWGHTSVEVAVDCAIEWNAKRVVLTHHEPSYGDDKIEEMYRNAVNHQKKSHPDSKTIIIQGRQDDEFEL